MVKTVTDQIETTHEKDTSVLIGSTPVSLSPQEFDKIYSQRNAHPITGGTAKIHKMPCDGPVIKFFTLEHLCDSTIADQRLTDAELDAYYRRERDTLLFLQEQDNPAAVRLLAHCDDKKALVVEQHSFHLLQAASFAGPRNLDTVLHYCQSAADGLAKLHKDGIFHRDIHPRNILRKHNSDDVMYVDFAAARTRDEMLEKITTNSDGGFISGNEYYMSFAQLQGYASERTDLWSLTSTLCDTIMRATMPLQNDYGTYVDQIESLIHNNIDKRDPQNHAQQKRKQITDAAIQRLAYIRVKGTGQFPMLKELADVLAPCFMTKTDMTAAKLAEELASYRAQYFPNGNEYKPSY